LKLALPLIRIDDLPWLEGYHSMAYRIFPIPNRSIKRKCKKKRKAEKNTNYYTLRNRYPSP